MKKLLLTSAIVAVAGAASAEITWSGGVEGFFNDGNKIAHSVKSNGDYNALYYSDSYLQDAIKAGNGTFTDASGKAFTQISDPLSFEADLTATGTAELDNGVSASLAYNFDLSESNGALTYDDAYPTLKIEAPQFTVTIGDVDHAAHAMFAGNSELEFTDDDGELVARVDTTVAGFAAGVSYSAADAAAKTKAAGDIFDAFEGLNAGSLTVGAKGEFAGASVSAAYENRADAATNPKNGKIEDTNIFGVSGGYEWNGVSGVVSYVTGDTNLDGNDESSIGLTASYTLNGYTIYGEAANLDDGIDDDANPAIAGNKHTYTDYKVGVKGEVSGATFDLGYYDDNDYAENDYKKGGANADFGYFVDATYEWNGAKFQAGYDSGEDVHYITEDPAKMKTEDFYGAFYAGAEYAVGEGASVYATYATGHEMDPAEDIKAGVTVGMKLSF